MNKIKSKLLKKINKTDKTLPRLIKKRLKAKHQPGLQISLKFWYPLPTSLVVGRITNITNEKGDITTNPTKIKKVMRKMYVQLYVN